MSPTEFNIAVHSQIRQHLPVKFAEGASFLLLLLEQLGHGRCIAAKAILQSSPELVKIADPSPFGREFTHHQAICPLLHLLSEHCELLCTVSRWIGPHPKRLLALVHWELRNGSRSIVCLRDQKWFLLGDINIGPRAVFSPVVVHHITETFLRLQHTASRDE